MKSFHLLSHDQVEKLPFLDGGVMVLDEGVAACLRDFFASEKAKTVTIGGLHPDPVLHPPNFANDYLYFTTDAGCAELQVTAAMPSTVVDGVRRDLLQVMVRGEQWLMEMVSCPLNPRCSLAHLQQKPLTSTQQQLQVAAAAQRGSVVPPPPSDPAIMSPERQLHFEGDTSVFHEQQAQQGQQEHPYKMVVVSLEGRIRDLERERNEAREALEETIKEVDRAPDSEARAVRQAEEGAVAQEQVGTLERVVADMVSQTKDAEVQAERSKNQAESLAAELDTVRAHLSAVRQDKDAQNEKYTATITQTKKENARLKQELSDQFDSKSTISRLKKDVDHLRGKLADASAQSESRNVESEGKLDRIQRDRDRLQNEMNILKDKLREKDKERAKVGKRLQDADKAKQRAAELEKELASVRAAPQQDSRTPRGRGHVRSKSEGPKRASRSMTRPGAQGTTARESHATVSSTVVKHPVNAEVVSPLFPDTTSERIGHELDHLTARFVGREKELMRCLQLLYGSDDEYQTLMEREEEERKQAEEERRAMQSELREVTDRFVQGSLAIEKLKDKEQGMAQKFLEADKEYAAELHMMRKEVLSARADATLAGSELTSLRHTMQAGAVAALAYDRTTAALQGLEPFVHPPARRHVVSPPVRLHP